MTEFVTISEAAEIARCSEKTLWRMRDQGRLRIGGSPRKRVIRYAHLIHQVEHGYPELGPKPVETPTVKRRPGKHVMRLTKP